jgi:hypothetical protein
MYIADGDYIKDIEVNDLRNRYTLTKGATQKMVNILVISTDSPRHLYTPIEMIRFPSPLFLLVEESLKLTLRCLAFSIPLFASADLGCVTSRSKKTLAPVRRIPD